MMGLDKMDTTSSSAIDTFKFQETLPPAQSQLDLEERRKAFWVLFIFDAYASVRSGTAVAIDGLKITTALPSSPSISEKGQPPMPSLDNARILYGTGRISSFAGLVLMVSLYRRCSSHVKSCYERQSTGGSGYGFWEHHYEIDRDLKRCSDTLIGTMGAEELLDDEFALALNLNLCAIDIYLHEAAIMKAAKDGLPETLITECNNRCSQAATRIVEGVSLSQELAQPKRTVFKQMNIFCMWPVCMAMQVLDRQLSSTSNFDLGHSVGVLRLLIAAIEDLEDVSGHWLQSISHIIKRLEIIDLNGVRRTDVNG